MTITRPPAIGYALAVADDASAAGHRDPSEWFSRARALKRASDRLHAAAEAHRCWIDNAMRQEGTDNSEYVRELRRDASYDGDAVFLMAGLAVEAMLKGLWLASNAGSEPSEFDQLGHEQIALADGAFVPLTPTERQLCAFLTEFITSVRHVPSAARVDDAGTTIIGVDTYAQFRAFYHRLSNVVATRNVFV